MDTQYTTLSYHGMCIVWYYVLRLLRRGESKSNYTAELNQFHFILGSPWQKVQSLNILGCTVRMVVRLRGGVEIPSRFHASDVALDDARALHTLALPSALASLVLSLASVQSFESTHRENNKSIQ